ncbi:helix-turn-helix domain-containing protein [Selenomonas sp. AE3005]|uniref:helix-turn-helix domain-containing protein n=1 Tax=Selenomonas sp. AE3005 TaxID=1485543 RepID=UPI0004841D09|nr:helix-turn-helix transcriptional regulator [Selenomonas sp. AE3005]
MDKSKLNGCHIKGEKSDTLSSDDYKSSAYIRPSSHEEHLQEITYDLARMMRNIRCLVKRRGVSIEDVEDGIGLHRGELSLLESSKAIPKVDLIMSVAAFLDIPVDDLVLVDLSYTENADDNVILKELIAQIIEDTRGKVINWRYGLREYYEGYKYEGKHQLENGDPPREFSELSECISEGNIEDEYYAYIPQGIYSFTTDEVYFAEINAGIVTIIGGRDKDKSCEMQYSLTLTPPGGKEYELAYTLWMDDSLLDLFNILVDEVKKALGRKIVSEDVLASLNSFIGENDDDTVEIDIDGCMEDFEKGGDD